MTYQLYHGDCLDIMPTLAAGSVDAVITDPPYGINNTRMGGRGINGWRDFTMHEWDDKRPPKQAFDLMLGFGGAAAIWGGNYFSDHLPPSSCWLFWDKGQRTFSLADGEMCWTNHKGAIRVFDYPRSRMLQENGLHPTQKPVALMKWVITKLTKPGDTIIDPFMGSGTTGVACMKTGRNFIGIELDADYFRIAEQRIKNAAGEVVITDKEKQSGARLLPMF
jgi:DNA modification methylase